MHGAYWPESSWHSNVDPGFEEANEKLGDGLFDGSGGCAVIDVSGGPPLSMRMLVVATWTGSALPTLSTEKYLTV